LQQDHCIEIEMEVDTNDNYWNQYNNTGS